MTLDRREFLATIASPPTATVAGCFGAQTSPTAGQNTNEARTAETDGNGASGAGLLLADGMLSLQYGFGNLRQEVVSGGPPKDGIPSIDEPNFSSATDANRRLREDSVVRDTEVKAYPQQSRAQSLILSLNSVSQWDITLALNLPLGTQLEF